MPYIHIVIAIIIIYNIFVLVIYGLDKIKANNNDRRISEKKLLILALLGGSPGALLGMKFFRHKTKKASFQFKIILILLIQAFLIYIAYDQIADISL